MKSLSFLIPAYNDETTITTQIAGAQTIGEKLGIPFEIVVINDGSTDGTGRILTELTKHRKKIRVLTHTNYSGYGATIKELYYQARKEWLFTIPGDAQIQARELLKLIPHQKEADIILGWRKSRHDTGFRQIQSRIYNALVPILFAISTHDVNSVRLMKSTVMKSVALRGSSAFTDAELVIKALQLGYKVKEVPIDHRHRNGASGGGGGGKFTVILPTIWEMVLCFLNLL